MTYDWTGETKKSELADQIVIALVTFGSGTLALALLLTFLP
jgi:hypothetical protein